jgi:hypothetical protein
MCMAPTERAFFISLDFWRVMNSHRSRKSADRARDSGVGEGMVTR